MSSPRGRGRSYIVEVLFFDFIHDIVQVADDFDLKTVVGFVRVVPTVAVVICVSYAHEAAFREFGGNFLVFVQIYVKKCAKFEEF